VTLRGLVRGAPGGGSSALVLGNVFAAFTCAPLGLPIGPVSGIDVAAIVYLGGFQIALAYACLSAGVRALPALEASLLLLVEPVLNPLWTFLVHGEIPGPFAVLGAIVILVATAVKTVADGSRAVAA
jgi:drug/metabolite transporter (DMT)-like permease